MLPFRRQLYKELQYPQLLTLANLVQLRELIQYRAMILYDINIRLALACLKILRWDLDLDRSFKRVFYLPVSYFLLAIGENSTLNVKNPSVGRSPYGSVMWQVVLAKTLQIN